MSISGTITQDKRFPIAGERVAVRASDVTYGRRVRWRLVDKPARSALPKYTPEYPSIGWITTREDNATRYTALFDPDTDGVYTLEAVEESHDGEPKHFYNDDSNASDDWTEEETEEYVIYVGAVMFKELRIGEHSCRLRVVSAEESTAAQSAHSETYRRGVISYHWDRSNCPKLVDPSTDAMRRAIESDSVVSYMKLLGGEGYTGSRNLIYAGYKTLTLITESDGLLPATITSDNRRVLRSVIESFNDHTEYGSGGSAAAVHTIAGNGVITSTAGTTTASLSTLINEMVSDHNAHIGSAALHPGGADATNTIVAGTAGTLASCCSRLIECYSSFRDHAKSNTRAGGYHAPPGDYRPITRIEHTSYIATSSTLASAITYAESVKDAMNAHFTCAVSTSAYHYSYDPDNTLSGALTIALLSSTDDDAIYIKLANKIYARIKAHFENKKHATGSAATYHYAPDYSGMLDKLSDAETREQADLITEQCYWALWNHIYGDESDTYHAVLLPTYDALNEYRGSAWLAKKIFDEVVAGGGADDYTDNNLQSVKTLAAECGFVRD